MDNDVISYSKTNSFQHLIGLHFKKQNSEYFKFYL